MASYAFKKTILPLLIKVGIGLGIGALVVVLTQGYLFRIGFIDTAEESTMNIRFQERYQRQKQNNELRDLSKESGIVIIGISQKDLEEMVHPFPFPRSYYAHLIENLNRAGAKVIGIDIMFSDASKDTASDALFAETLQKYDNVILAVKRAEGSGIKQAEIASTERRYSNHFYQFNKRVGYAEIPGTATEVVRKYVPFIREGIDPVFDTPTFAFAVLNRYFNLGPYLVADPEKSQKVFIYHNSTIPRYDARSFLMNYYGPNQSFRYISFSQAIDDSTFETKVEKEYGEQINLFDEETMAIFKDKIVLIGSVMPEDKDLYAMPIRPAEGESNLMNGVEIHATAIQNILDGYYLVRAEPMVEIVLVILLSTTFFLGILKLKQIKIKRVIILELGAALIVALTIFGVYEFALLSFTNGGTIINIINPSLAVILAYLGTSVYQYLAERQQKALIKNVFSHYISSAVVNELVANPEKARLGGDKRELTVFFSDIAGFTTISERYLDKPEGLVELLNEYLDEMTGIILKHQGTLDKYEGDAIMAFWGAPIPQKDHALRTCLAALDMQKRLAALRPKWMKDRKVSIEARFGINTGTMIVGNMGGKDRFDYTVIGDSVNLASRLEGANKQYGTKIMLSDMTYQHVKDKVMVRELDMIQVKGKNEPVKVFELMGTSDLALTDNQKQSLEIYQEGLKLYRQRQFEEAIAYMQQARQLDETCTVAEVYEQRAGLYQIHPPPDNWNGVFVMTTK